MLASALHIFLALWRGVLGRSPCCGAPGMLGGGLRAGLCPGCGADLSGVMIDGAVPLLAGLACATSGLGTAFLIAVHLAPDHPALLPVALAASLGCAAAALPRIAGGLTGLQWVLRMPGHAALPANSSVLLKSAPPQHAQRARDDSRWGSAQPAH